MTSALLVLTVQCKPTNPTNPNPPNNPPSGPQDPPVPIDRTDRAVRGTSLNLEVNRLTVQQQGGLNIDIQVKPCTGTAGKCLFFKGEGEPEKEIYYGENYTPMEIGLMGFHFPGKYETIYTYSFSAPFPGKAEVRIFDPNEGKSVASVNVESLQDYNAYNSYFSVVKGPEQKGYPFLGPGLHYITGNYWSNLCLFDKSKIDSPDPVCGTGFRSSSIRFTGSNGKPDYEDSKFRHNRGWLLDVDNDGWDDIHLTFFKYILTLSGRTGARISLAKFDVANYSEPNVEPFFHHGRYYGAYTSFLDPQTNNYMTLLTSGSVVGSFDNWNCNVSRYTAAIRWTRDSSGVKATLPWSEFVSFSNTSFTYDYSSVNSYFRKGDLINKCIHRFSDSMFNLNGKPSMAYSQFETTERYDCELEQLNSAKNQSSAAQQQMQICMGNGTKGIRGTWNVYTKDAVTGARLASQPRAYLWGRAKNFLPATDTVYFLERFDAGDGKIRFDYGDHSPETIQVSQIQTNGAWENLGEVATPGFPPRIEALECFTSQSGMSGNSPDATCGQPELIAKDIDGDGLNDIQLNTPPGQSERWLGYSNAAKRVIVKIR